MANTGRHRTNVATLFDVFCEVAAPDAAATGKPTIVQKYPEDFNDAAILDSVRLFAFPAGADIDGVDTVQLFVFALTDVHRLHTYGFCRYTPRTNTCICLLTGYQWTNVFFTLLNHISVVINNGTQEDLDSLLTRIYHTDTPAVGDRLGFEVGKHRVTVDIPDLTRLPTLKDDKFMLEFYNGVTSRQMMSVYASLLKERRILFTGRKLSQVSSCVIAASTLLYPMTWWHIFLPIIPAERRDMISAPMPYIIGIPKQLLDAQTMKELGDVMIVDLDERSLQASHDDFAALPSEVQSHLRSALKTGVDMGDALSRVFLRATLTLFGLYRVGLVRDEQTTVVSWDKDKFLAEQRPQYQGYLASLLGHDGAQYLEQFIHHRLIALNTGCPINDEFEKEAASFDAKIKSQVRENANDVIGALKDKVQSIQIREKFGKLTAREIRKSRSGKRAARKASSHMTKSVERGPNGAFQPLSFENIQWSSEQDGPQSSEEDEDSLEGEGAAGAIGDLIDLGDTPTKESPPRPPPAPHSGRASAPIDFDDLLAQPSRVAPPQHQPPSLPRPALVMLLGDSCSGKTCILIRFKDGTFLNSNFISTVGIDYRNKVVSVNNKLVKLQIFDTAGQERFRSVTSAYYRDADALLVVFDVTNRKSFENVRSWVAQIKDFAKDNVVITLIGNKADLSAQRVVKPAECSDLAAFYNIPYIETSAKTGARIEDVFLLTAKRLIAAANGEPITEDVIDISASSQPSYWSSCCYGSGKASST